MAAANSNGRIGSGSSPTPTKSLGSGQTLMVGKPVDASGVEPKSAFKELPKNSMQTA